MVKLIEPREQHGFRNVWRSVGKIQFRIEGNPSSKIFFD